MARWLSKAFTVAAMGVIPLASHAQAADSLRRFSLFGGAEVTSTNEHLAQPEVGASVDFLPKSLPFALRATLAFSQEHPPLNNTLGDLRYGTFSLDAVTRRSKGIFGIHPYLLGGLGVTTRADYTFIATPYVPFGQDASVATVGYPIHVPRLNWAYAEAGGGLEFGRLFLQAKLQVPVASNGITRLPVNFGFRF